MLQSHLKRGISVIAAIIFACIFASCKNEKQQHVHAVNEPTTYYTCSMHPQINLPKPGKCPICGMALIQAQKTVVPKADELQLNAQQIQLGNISVDTINSSNLVDETVLTGTINFDQQKTTSISSRVMGRIERLYFQNVGEYVSKGQKLFDIYSEDLNSATQEYRLAIERKKVLDNSIIDFNQLIQSARNKLKLWGLSDAQISQLAKTNKPSPLTTFYSNANGYITTLDAKEGEYVMEGGAVVHLADLSSLWVEAQVYSSQLASIDRSDIAFIQIPGMPGRELSGKIEFVSPEINAETRINLVRITIQNPGNNLKPGMPAYVRIKSRQRNALTLPIDAVLRDAKGATVWIMTSKNTFKNRMVEVGAENGDRIEIKGGLKHGDVVVITGAYLLNSEFIFKNGINPMEGMKM